MIKKHIRQALSTLQTPTAKPRAITEAVEAWPWKWELVGNETDQEKVELEAMHRAAQEFLTDIITGAEPRWLTFLGLSGNGKTYLAERIAEWLRKWGEKMYDRHFRKQRDPDHNDARFIFSYQQECGVFIKWGDLITECRNREFYRYRRAQNDFYKIVDDLGANSLDRDGNVTPFAIQQMGEMLDRRLRKWSVFTANYSRTDFGEKFDVRIASRLMRDRNVIVNSEVRDFALRKEAMAK